MSKYLVTIFVTISCALALMQSIAAVTSPPPPHLPPINDADELSTIRDGQREANQLILSYQKNEISPEYFLTMCHRSRSAWLQCGSAPLASDETAALMLDYTLGEYQYFIELGQSGDGSNEEGDESNERIDDGTAASAESHPIDYQTNQEYIDSGLDEHIQLISLQRSSLMVTGQPGTLSALKVRLMHIHRFIKTSCHLLHRLDGKEVPPDSLCGVYLQRTEQLADTIRGLKTYKMLFFRWAREFESVWQGILEVVLPALPGSDDVFQRWIHDYNHYVVVLPERCVKYIEDNELVRAAPNLLRQYTNWMAFVRVMYHCLGEPLREDTMEQQVTFEGIEQQMRQLMEISLKRRFMAPVLFPRFMWDGIRRRQKSNEIYELLRSGIGDKYSGDDEL